MTITTIILFLLPLTARLAWDYDTIKVRKRFIDSWGHAVRWAITCMVTVLIAALNHLRIDFTTPLWCGIVAQAGIFFLIFDWGLNILRGLPWSYRSPMAQHPSFFERIRQKTPLIVEVTVKIWLAAAGIATYINYDLI